MLLDTPCPSSEQSLKALPLHSVLHRPVNPNIHRHVLLPPVAEQASAVFHFLPYSFDLRRLVQKLVVAAALATISEALKKEESVAFLKFGTFKISKRAARKGRNPQTGKPIQIPASKLPVFKASAAFKELVNGKKKKK